MIVKIFTKEDGPEMRDAIDLGKRLESEGYEVAYFDADEDSAVQPMGLYDVYSFPSFVVAKDDGAEIECWRGKIPMEDDIKRFLSV